MSQVTLEHIDPASFLEQRGTLDYWDIDAQISNAILKARRPSKHSKQKRFTRAVITSALEHLERPSPHNAHYRQGSLLLGKHPSGTIIAWRREAYLRFPGMAGKPMTQACRPTPRPPDSIPLKVSPSDNLGESARIFVRSEDGRLAYESSVQLGVIAERRARPVLVHADIDSFRQTEDGLIDTRRAVFSAIDQGSMRIGSTTHFLDDTPEGYIESFERNTHLEVVHEPQEDRPVPAESVGSILLKRIPALMPQIQTVS